MQYNSLGKSGLKVSRLAFGSWLTFQKGGAENAHSMVDCAIDLGINFLDTADIYDLGVAEEFLSQSIKGRRRSKLVIATKLYFPMSDDVNDRGLGRKHIFESIDASLRRLGTDYVDLYQCHRFDPDVPLAETVAAMGDLIRSGKVLYWGTSCWTASQLREAVRLCKELGVTPPISEQPPYNMLSRDIEAEVMPACAELGIGIINWSPLAQGFLTGKYRDGSGIPADSRAAHGQMPGGFLDKTLAKAEEMTVLGRIQAVADQFSIELPALAIAWCLRRSELSAVILGASKPAQLEQNLLALDVNWTSELDKACQQALSCHQSCQPE